MDVAMHARLSIAQLFAQQAATTPDAPAIRGVEQRPLSYAGLQQHLRQTASRLHSLQIGRQDRVALVLPNGPAMATAFLAVAACATSAPLNPAYRAAEFAFYLHDLNAKAVMVEANLDSPVRAVAAQHGIPLLELQPDPITAGLFTLTGTEVAIKPSPTFPAPGDITDNMADDIALLLHTSGTTARPKLVPLTQHNLLCSARNIGATLALSPADRCLNLMPLFHIHGLVAALLASLAAGGSIICTPGFDAAHFFPWLQEQQPTWYTAVPTMHQALLARAAVDGGPKGEGHLRFVRSSSAALPPTVMTALEALFKAPVIEAYGMTEAAHQMASNPLPPRPRKAGSVGMAAGPEIAIMAEGQTTFLTNGAIGEVAIRGANVTAGYLHNPEANANAFVDGWFRTGDQGYLDAEGYLYLTGRLKEIINRGGEKIVPREVDEVLLQHPAVAQAITFAVPHVSLGDDVAAAVVLQPGGVTTERELRHFAFAHLADYKVPTQILLVDEIPKGPTGKLQRIGLAEKLASQLARAFIPPATPMEETLVHIWQVILNQAPIGSADNFFALGGDSLAAARVVAHVRAHFAIELPLAGIFQEPTLGDQARLIEEQLLEAIEAATEAEVTERLERIGQRQ